jgi:membrane-associated phospholipid phosphatase
MAFSHLGATDLAQPPVGSLVERCTLSEELMKEYRFHALMTAIVLLVGAFCLYGAYAWEVTVAPGQLISRAVLLLVLLAGAAFYRWRRLEKPVNLILMAFWGVLVSNLYLIPEHIAARGNVAASDVLLVRVDAALGVEVPDVLRLMEAWPAVAGVLSFAYGMLIFMVVLAVMVPPMCGRMDKAKEYAIACAAAAALAIPLFAVFQAVGPWAVYGYAPSPDQAGYVRTFEALKSGAPFVIDLGNQDGLITFPSFHAVLAVLTAVALWPIRYLRWPSTVLSALIVISTVSTGWHYVSDVLGGLLIAAAALAVARGYLRLERAPSWVFWKRAKAAALAEGPAPTVWQGREESAPVSVHHP